MQSLRRFDVPARSITLWWLGQAGFVVKSPGGKLIAIDPYLSNSCKALGEQFGFDMDRLVDPPIAPAELAGIDAYVLTHSHQDHMDPQTLTPYREAGGKGPFVAPHQTADKLRGLGVPDEQIMTVWPSRRVALGDLDLTAPFAIPFAGDDVTHVGYLISAAGGPIVYFTGDTAYHEILAISVAERKPDALVAVINGAFRNMSPAEAARLARQPDSRLVIPCHHDLFPDNPLPARLLRTNLMIEGIGDRYRPLDHGGPFTITHA